MSKENMEFKTEVKQILDLMINSLYSHKEIFLRELISNASDAIDKVKYASLTSEDVLESEKELKIKITPDKDAKTITISDNGIGMSRDEAITELGTIAHSGTKEFLAALKSKEAQDNPELIGQFGVGFYSSFMVADKVTVITRKAGQPTTSGIKWESSADGSYSIEDTDKLTKGTDIILHLKEDSSEYLQEWEIRKVVAQYSDFIEHPVVMDTEMDEVDENDPEKKVRVTKEDLLNSRKAIWLKNKADVTEEEYNQFYKNISNDFTDPASVVHYRAEGTNEFTALMYIPTNIPFGIFYKDYKMGPMLYVKRVRIMNNCEQLIPPYLRFVRGVVDSSDLPLNVSREILQNNRQIDLISKNITKKVLAELKNMKDNEYDKYVEFYKQMGKILREGIHYDAAKKDEIADLLLIESTETDSGSFTTLEKYVDAMKPEQEEIYFIVSASKDEALASPYLESFKAKGYEVLIMLEEVDDIIMSSLMEYKGKKVKSVLKGDVTLSDDEKKEQAEDGKKLEGLIGLIKEQLKDKVKDVRLSGRLKDSPCCLVGDEDKMDHNMESIMKAMGQEVPKSMRVLELNPKHPVFEAMNGLYEADKDSEDMKEYINLLYEQSLIVMGIMPEDIAGFTKTLNKLMVKSAK